MQWFFSSTPNCTTWQSECAPQYVCVCEWAVFLISHCCCLCCCCCCWLLSIILCVIFGLLNAIKTFCLTENYNNKERNEMKRQSQCCTRGACLLLLLLGQGEKGDEGHEQLWEKLLTMLLVINIYSRVESSWVECSSPLRPCACVYECVGVCARVCVLVKNL